ncbi:TraL conjugative transposon family protein [uncultured Duncaniella sp.]|uniref:TraL conjugative transposon family protein n=1 Tax=uncultured Duncaniella sp. TaxID=2768039 RepID=UPI00272C526E|nr:TraL conjugative transposon family protein [uncultured Duncaniella sp.]
MNKFQSMRSAIYNKVWGKPKSALGAYLQRKCDGIPANRRLTIITVLLSLFIITAFFVFGDACYRIGRGQALMERIEPEHIEGLELPSLDNGDTPDIGQFNESRYELSGTENENQ